MSATPEIPLPVLGHFPSYWEPPKDISPPIKTHAGENLPANFLYLAPPPQEIGKVLTAFSSIPTDTGTRVPKIRWIAGTLAGLIIVLSGTYLFAEHQQWNLSNGFLFLLIAIGGIGAVVNFSASKPDYYTSYVGETGVAHFKYGNRNHPIAKAQVFLFENATVLNIKKRMRYSASISYTTYSYVWKDTANKPVHTISGQHDCQKGSPSPKHPHHFAVSAEKAWSHYLLQRCLRRFEQQESIAFPVQGRGTIYISARELKFELDGKVEEIPLEEMGDMSLHAGHITLARIGAKKGFLGTGQDGIYTFSYACLSNARLFVALLAAVGKPALGSTASVNLVCRW